MKSTIQSIQGLEILDSRGNPTIRVKVLLSDGAIGTASVPSGASTGEYEAVELRDQNPSRYQGKGVQTALSHIHQTLAPALKGMDPTAQSAIDHLLIELDGSPNKSNLGANALLGVSMATACAAAQSVKLPLYRYLGGVGSFRMPIPMMNILNGGAHADNSVDLQEFMVMPLGAPSFSEALRYGTETFHALKTILKKKGYATSVGDEGGFAPNLKSNEDACELIVEAIETAGYQPGSQIGIALDAAASSFCKNEMYHLTRSGQGSKTTAQLLQLYQQWCQKYPILSIEDPLDEHDWDGFQQFTQSHGSSLQIVGDDLYVTNPLFIAKGIQEKASNAVLIKLNQIGTVTETVQAIRLCQKAGWNYIISHRSGETEDTFIADFTVAMGGGQIKTGSASRSDRIAKYNRLLEIESELGSAAVFG